MIHVYITYRYLTPKGIEVTGFADLKIPHKIENVQQLLQIGEAIKQKNNLKSIVITDWHYFDKVMHKGKQYHSRQSL